MPKPKNCRRRRCPEPPAAVPEPTPATTAAEKSVSKLADAKVDQRIISVDGEATRLWNHVLFGTGTCIGMIEGYAALRMPGDPIPALISLVERLTGVIKSLEEKNANSSPPND